MIELLGTAICGTLAGLGVLGALVAVAKSFLFICEPHEVMIFSGRQHTRADGNVVGYRVIFGGRAFRWPILERAERMDVRNIPIDINTTNAYSKGGIPLNVHAIANVKVSKDPRIIGNAIERFLGRDPAEIKRVAKETLEGHLRGVLATLTPEEVNEDRLKFAGALMEESHEDFDRLGLHLDTLKIQNVSDDANYLNSIGRKQIAIVHRNAEVAEATNLSDAEQAEASCRREGEVANENAASEIVQAVNGVAQEKAEFEAKARSEEERTTQAALQARAEAELELQQIRQELEKLRLQSDVVLPAQARREAEALNARGKAAYQEAEGKAQAEVLNLMTKAWHRAGDDAKDIFLIQNLETVLETVVKRVNAIEIEDVTLLDGGDGRALPNYVASHPAMVTSVLNALSQTTGVDILAILGEAGGAKTIQDKREKEVSS